MRGMIILAALLVCGAAGAQNCAVSTNLGDAMDMGTMGVELSLGVARRWSLSAGARYNPFSYGDDPQMQVRDRKRSFSMGTRFWPWHIWSGWWLSAKGQWEEFNKSGAGTPLTREGDRYGGGLGAGYAWMLSPHLNFDVGLGAWAGWASTVTYACPRCGRIVDSSRGFFLLPDNILLAITYVF